MSYKSEITVQSNGTLKVNGGEIINGKIIVENGGTLEISDDGVIDLNYYDHLEIKSGGVLDIISGEIHTSSIID
jgi:flagellar basal body rod protein FlgF